MPWPATRCLCMLSTWLLFVLLVPCALLSIVCPLPSRSPQSPLQCPLRSGSPQNPLKNPLLSSGGYLLHPGGILPCRPFPGTPVCLFLQALFHSTSLAHHITPPSRKACPAPSQYSRPSSRPLQPELYCPPKKSSSRVSGALRV